MPFSLDIKNQKGNKQLLVLRILTARVLTEHAVLSLHCKRLILLPLQREITLFFRATLVIIYGTVVSVKSSALILQKKVRVGEAVLVFLS